MVYTLMLCRLVCLIKKKSAATRSVVINRNKELQQNITGKSFEDNMIMMDNEIYNISYSHGNNTDEDDEFRCIYICDAHLLSNVHMITL